MTTNRMAYVCADYQEHFSPEVTRLLARLNAYGYNLEAGGCRKVVLRDDVIVGAFHYGESYFNQESVFRLHWLVADEDGNGVGEFILRYVECAAKPHRYVYASYSLDNDRSARFFDRHHFIRVGDTTNNETDSRKRLDAPSIVRTV
ncbi:MAG: hypothetical protein MI867_16595 [Pseudomonadales bacterium]|nr:hypothetical protein [Pseudomonadales bacterium]